MLSILHNIAANATLYILGPLMYSVNVYEFSHRVNIFTNAWTYNQLYNDLYIESGNVFF